jgi:hypothetical protein
VVDKVRSRTALTRRPSLKAANQGHAVLDVTGAPPNGVVYNDGCKTF